MTREAKPKRKRGGGIDHAASDDSDFDDLHNISSATAALRLGDRSLAGTAAAQTGGRLTAKSSGTKSFASKSLAGNISLFL